MSEGVIVTSTSRAKDEFRADLPATDAQAMQNEKVKALVEALEFIAAKVSWEINPSNYTHQEVCDMNADWCEVGNAADAALAAIKKGQDND